MLKRTSTANAKIATVWNDAFWARRHYLFDSSQSIRLPAARFDKGNRLPWNGAVDKPHLAVNFDDAPTVMGQGYDLAHKPFHSQDRQDAPGVVQWARN